LIQVISSLDVPDKVLFIFSVYFRQISSSFASLVIKVRFINSLWLVFTSHQNSIRVFYYKRCRSISIKITFWFSYITPSKLLVAKDRLMNDLFHNVSLVLQISIELWLIIHVRHNFLLILCDRPFTEFLYMNYQNSAYRHNIPNHRKEINHKVPTKNSIKCFSIPPVSKYP
jgi:hypothetical protein